MASQVESIKWVPGTDFIVDGFAFKNPRCHHYFLTHCHSDHTVGLHRSFDNGVIYCSHVTARLLVHDMGIKPQVVKPLAVGTPVVIAGVRVTPLDANHCPGAVMFLFEVPTAAAAGAKGRTRAAATTATSSRSGAVPSTPPLRGPAAAAPRSVGSTAAVLPAGQDQRKGSSHGEDDAAAKADPGGSLAGTESPCRPEVSEWDATAPTHNILHTGDCRWQRWMRDQSGLAGVRVDTLFLDTTYAAPKHTLPPQQEAISTMVQTMRDVLAAEPRTLFVVAAYHIGKERAFLGAAQQLGARVWCSSGKRSVLRLLDLPPELVALLVDDPREAAVHVTKWGLRPEDLQAHLDRHPGVWKQAVGIRPTGWALRRSGGLSIRREANVAIIGVPYSEHSSWTDLCDAVSQLRPRTLVPTVNASTPAQRRALVDRFAALMDLSADRSRLDVYLGRSSRVDGPAGCDDVTQDIPGQGFHGGSGSSGQSGSAAVAAAATTAAIAPALRVDLESVDVVEQERILADLQQRRQLLQQRHQQLQQSNAAQKQQQSRGKRRSRGATEDGLAGLKVKRPQAPGLRPIGADGQAAVGCKVDEAVTGGRQPSGNCSGCRCLGDTVPRREGRELCQLVDGGSDCSSVIDLSLDIGDEGAACDIATTSTSGTVCAHTRRGQQPDGEGCRAVGGGAGDGRRVLGSSFPGRNKARPAAEARALQSSIRNFFAPLSRAAAAVLGSQQRATCWQDE